MDRGLTQRIKKNIFRRFIYRQKIVKDGIIHKNLYLSSKGLFKRASPSKKIRTHINGILVKDTVTDDWVILEDNLRVPSGASYPLSIRDTYRKIYPEFFEKKNKPIKDILQF